MAHYYCLLSINSVISEFIDKNLRLNSAQAIVFFLLAFFSWHKHRVSKGSRTAEEVWMSAKHKASSSSKQSTSKNTHTVDVDDKKMDHLLNFYVCSSLLSKERKKFNCFERFLWCERISYRVYCFSPVMLHAIRHSFLWRFFAVSQLDLWLSPADDFARVDRAAELLCN